ncbi:aldose 1-epimerase family protein [Sabulilitoribacter multivorans]|uniref:Aldose 1-epimerase family protein n=1 Tax=Flaviramulus multivorans TaxID=1304750 RepID=A0ABS9IHI8_9FLAO|nr:aldose 1-epimerase family protein [Flaviramulus multivorans]MCF7560189.1 aldose 1-epimerase family protein [Flaviramulus multivorans]
MYTLQNHKLKIAVKKTGAELCEISSTKNNTAFMWDADPEVWGSYAPNLFPVIGALKDDSFIYEGKTYAHPKHGFLRRNKDVELFEQTENSLTFRLTSNDELLKTYPFQFEFYITYTLKDNCIDILHTVKNRDSKPMYFSVGGHPAFKCPVFDNESYEDYYLEFEHNENSKRHLINMANGLISNKSEAVFNNSNTIALTHELFEADALVFKDLKSRNVRLKSKHHGTILTVDYPDFSYLGIWAKPSGNYVCIEPWLGIADSEQTNQNLKEKEGIMELQAGKTFKATYRIEIDNAHLV